MIIKQRRVLNLDNVLPLIKEGNDIVLGLKDPERFGKTLELIGFTNPLNIGSCILPPAKLGPVSKFNAEGKFIKHKDKKMEEVTRVIEWHWTECHGEDRVEQSDFFDIPYKDTHGHLFYLMPKN